MKHTQNTTRYDEIFSWFSSCMALIMCPVLIIEEFFHSPFLFIKHVYYKISHFRAMYRRLIRKEAWSFWKVAQAEIRVVHSHWSSSSVELNNKVFIWILDSVRKKSTEIIRWMRTQSKSWKFWINYIFHKTFPSILKTCRERSWNLWRFSVLLWRSFQNCNWLWSSRRTSVDKWKVFLWISIQNSSGMVFWIEDSREKEFDVACHGTSS